MAKWHIVIFFLCCCNLYSLNAQNTNQLERQRIKINEEIERADALLKTNKTQQKNTLEDVELVQKKIEARQALIENLNNGAVELENNILSTHQKLDSLNQVKDTLQNQYENLLRQRYISRMQNSKWYYILASDGLQKAFLRWQYYKQLDDNFHKRTAEILESSLALDSLSSSLNLQSEKQIALKEKEELQKEELDSSLKQKEEILQNLQKTQSNLRADLKEKNRAREELNLAIEKAIQEAMSASSEISSTSEVATEDKGPSSSENSSFSKSRLAWPIKGIIVSRFGKQAHPSINGVFIENNGIDIQSQQAQVQSVAQGKVISVQSIPGHDLMIMIEHKGYYTIYSKLKTSFVKKGQQVATGDPIGELNPDTSNRFKLHFELWRGKEKLNPAVWLKK